jgi:deaminated glutathione amidase
VTFRAALVQMRSGRDMARNYADAAELIREAAAKGAALISTPEMTNILEPDRSRLRSLRSPVNSEHGSISARWR